jgi:2-polyprenyl-3-methyl-5-hydroxy-6-metoxy-1,4-benzoquinol methylase
VKGCTVSLRDRILGTHTGFKIFKSAIASDRAMGVFAREYIKAQPGERILDAGCGVGDMREYLPDVDYTGIDFNPDYIEGAKRRYTDGARFLNASVDDLADLGVGDFDAVIVISVLHHLTDEQVTNLVTSLPKVMKPGARLVTVDPAWLPEQATTARVLIALDRGRFVRDVEGYRRLLEAGFTDVEFTLRQDLLRLPYTYCVSTSTLA